MKSNFQTRIRLISICILLFALCLVAKLYLVQIVNGDLFRSEGNKQYISPTEYSFNRGTIYFQDKDGNLISAATLKDGYILSMDPKLVTDPEGEYQKINALLPIDHTDFITKAGKQNDTYEQIEDKVDNAVGNQIQALKLPGVSVYDQKWRYYPGNQMAAHAVGFVAYKGNDLSGRYGLERYYDDVLKRNASDVYVNFFAEIFSNIDSVVQNDEKQEGDIVTTIEPTTESYLEETLQKVNEQYHSQSTGGIIINPKTGEIYAMALDPTFNLNSFQNEKSSAIFENDVIENVHEMGSVIKPLTMAAGIDLGVISSSTMYDDKGSVTLNGKTISNFDKGARGVIPMQEAMGESLNVGFVFAEQQIGNQNFANYMNKFGLGEKTGIDLPNEAQDLISNLKSPRDIEYATASFGQGIALTPIATVRALSAVANGGYLITPHLVKQINYKLGFSKTISYPPGPQVIKPSTSQAVTQMLVTDYDTYLQNGKAKNPHYSIAEKTGTAQIANPNGGGYYANEYLHSFVGYLPAYNPQFLVFMYTVNPQGVQYSSETLAPAFVDMTKFLINYYQIPPDR